MKAFIVLSNAAGVLEETEAAAGIPIAESLIDWLQDSAIDLQPGDIITIIERTT